MLEISEDHWYSCVPAHLSFTWATYLVWTHKTSFEWNKVSIETASPSFERSIPWVQSFVQNEICTFLLKVTIKRRRIAEKEEHKTTKHTNRRQDQRAIVAVWRRGRRNNFWRLSYRRSQKVHRTCSIDCSKVLRAMLQTV